MSKRKYTHVKAEEDTSGRVTFREIAIIIKKMPDGTLRGMVAG